MRRLTLLMTALLISSCSVTVPKPTLCIHVQENGYFRCKNTKTNEKYDRSYVDMPRWIAISPSDYGDILDFIDKILERSGINPEDF
jgi:hypothetical protein